MRFPVLSFRWRVMLSMVAVVSLASLAVLMATQRRVRANYDRMFRFHFERQLDFFVALQESRVESVRHSCLDVASSDEVVDMLNEHMTALTGVIKRHHSVLDKFVGDADEAEALDPMSLHGYSDPVAVYRVRIGQDRVPPHPSPAG